ncbi:MULTISPECIES: glycoside hydrolase family 25 protein [unclassified Paenibacillus]|uniref:glycoside hydrolase family 25 protein n=1 Tax=unclassified Paenibacillus TaxID=185978 RepID=UPI0009A58BF1|nr:MULTISPECIES: glycoside hydrolase family 25 protein [unclassified Paenibacillus]SLJ92642.1 lysozyme [Paenibacillus sp. RU5A]SOC58546.1 lysozyme [Paenibacillus sp. RU26A]SOC67598.1 lysozyme [Paenibacillus sp. RU5M]
MQARKTGNAQGIDVSHHNGNIDFKKVAADGISFVFIKATQGKSFRSPKFLQSVKDAKAAGLLIGAYHYVDDSAGSVETAKAEAANFYKAIQDAGGIGTFDLPPVMDYESNKNSYSKATITAVATTFLAEIHKLTRVKPLVYTYPAFIGNFTGLSSYPLWIARYSTQTPADVSGWTRWDFWQYSDGSAGGYLPRGNRKVDGISGAVDLNEFDGTIAEMRAKYSPIKEDKPVTQPVTTRDINVPSKWAEAAWAEVTANGYFDGTRPGAQITREESAVVINRLRKNFLALIAGTNGDVKAMDLRLKKIEASQE